MDLKVERLYAGRSGKVYCLVNGGAVKVYVFCLASVLDIGHVIEILAEHLGYELYSRQVFDYVFADELTVTQNGNAVAYFIYLLEEVGYEDYSYAFCLEIAHQVEEFLNFLFVQ